MTVCAPSFAAARRLSQPSDLLDVVLIHETWHDMPYSDRMGWKAWFQSAGVTDPRRVPRWADRVEPSLASLAPRDGPALR